MSDLRPVLQEMSDRADATGMLTPGEIRSCGERRRKRILVVTTTSVVAGTVAAGLLIGGVAPDGRSGDPVRQPNPTTSSSSTVETDDRIGIIGPPPPGTPPTGPAAGELVAAAEFWMGTWVYADGRIINVDNHSGRFQGYVVRQLTPSGVEAMRAYLLEGAPDLTPLTDNGGRLIVRVGGRLMEDRNYTACVSDGQSRYCPGFSHPEEWLPASAWEDPTFRPFVPHAYDVCLTHPRRSSAAEVLSAEAADILRAGTASDSTARETCWVLGTDAARGLADSMEQAGATRDVEFLHDLAFRLPSASGNGGTLKMQPILPQEYDAAYCWPGGNPC